MQVAKRPDGLFETEIRRARCSTNYADNVRARSARCTDERDAALLVQALNGLQLGVLLFLIAAGLTWCSA